MATCKAAGMQAEIAAGEVPTPGRPSTINVRVINEACDRAANTFRRQMLALAEYRRPPRSDQFVAIRQANLANQQVVQNVESQKSQTGNASNEQGLPPVAPALPADARGAGLAPADGGSGVALGELHRPSDGGGQGPVEAQCPEARRAERGGP
jgi:hypothetical protein